MTDHPIPECPEQVTDEWLTSMLHENGAVDQASITAHTTELVEMQGAAAVVARLELAYDVVEVGAPRTVIAKFAPPHEPIRALIHALGGYVREVEFYRQFGADPGIPTPHWFPRGHRSRIGHLRAPARRHERLAGHRWGHALS